MSAPASSGSALLVSLPAPTPVPSAVHAHSSSPPAPLDAPLSPASASASGTFQFQSGLDLDNIRATLIRLEESIIFALIERAQFRMNRRMYLPMAELTKKEDATATTTTTTTPPEPNVAGGDQDQSLLSRFLASTEALHASVRRYTSPCEHPFSDASTLPAPLLPQLTYPSTIQPNAINHNARILSFYLGTVLPSICAAGDDSNYGSGCICDVQALQLLSKRIHYGKFVAESKFLADRPAFTEAIRARDLAALTRLITKPIIEEQILQRVRTKAAAYGRPPNCDQAQQQATSTTTTTTTTTVSDDPASFKIPPAVISELYEIIMIMTKDVQIEYLLQRLD